MSIPISNFQNPDLPFKAGDRLTRSKFHYLYEQQGDSATAELIDGAVYVREPLGNFHAKSDAVLGGVLFHYSARTPGLEVGHNASIFLSERDEVQPDVYLRITPVFGGQSRDADDRYIEGAPELVAEIAHTSKSIDLGIKRKRYLKAGVIEYLVFCLEPDELYWFELQRGVQLAKGEDGVIRSNIFPGLWIHVQSLLEGSAGKLLDVLDLGLASPEHEQFVARLTASGK